MIRKVLKFALLILLAIALCVGAVFAYIAYKPYNLKSVQKDPIAQIEQSISRTHNALRDGLAFNVPDIVHTASQKGAIQFDLFTKKKQHFSTQLHLRDTGYALSGSIPSGTNTIKFGVWANQEEIVVDIPAMFNNTVYGVSLTTLKEDAETSALWEVLGISYDEIAPTLEMLTSSEADEQNPFTQLKLKKKLESVVRSWPVSVTEEMLNMDIEALPVYRVSYVLSPKHICSLLDILSEYTKQMSIPKLTQEGIAQIQTVLENSKSSIKEKEASAIIDIYLHTETQVIVQANCRIDWFEGDEAATVTASVILGQDPAESAQYRFVAETSLPGAPQKTFSLDYHRTHAHNLPGRKLTITSDENTYTVMHIQFNDITESFEMELLDGSIKANGYWLVNEKEASIHTTVENFGEISIKFLPESEMPSVPEYTNLLTLDKKTLNAWFGNGEIPPMQKNKTADIAITGSNGTRKILYIKHNYLSLGELLSKEKIAVLGNGKISDICYDEINGSSWNIYINGMLYTGDPYDAFLGSETSIAIIAVAP